MYLKRYSIETWRRPSPSSSSSFAARSTRTSRVGNRFVIGFVTSATSSRSRSVRIFSVCTHLSTVRRLIRRRALRGSHVARRKHLPGLLLHLGGHDGAAPRLRETDAGDA